LIVDGHASHVKSQDVIDYAVRNDITMMCLPPHTTHFLQPLDRSFFKPLKAYYDGACRSYVANHPGRSITKMQFGGLLNTAWGKAATSANAINGFRICGIYPISADIIPEHVYEPSYQTLH
jgi:DDE superfamily endonuclease